MTEPVSKVFVAGSAASYPDGVCCPECGQRIQFLDPDIKARNQKIIQMREDQKTYEEIGEVFGISKERVRKILRKIAPHLQGHVRTTRKDLAEVEKRRKREAQQKVEAEVLGLRGEGLTQAQIAQRLEVSPSKVNQILLKHGQRKKRTAQEKSELRRAVIKDQQAGNSVEDIARNHNISTTWVRMLLRG